MQGCRGTESIPADGGVGQIHPGTVQNLANEITYPEIVLSGDLNTLLLSVRTLFLEVVLAIKTLLRPL